MVERRNISCFITGLTLKSSMYAKQPYNLKNSNEKKGPIFLKLQHVRFILYFYIYMYHITQNHVVYKCEVISINITTLIG